MPLKRLITLRQYVNGSISNTYNVLQILRAKYTLYIHKTSHVKDMSLLQYLQDIWLSWKAMSQNPHRCPRMSLENHIEHGTHHMH